MSPQGFVRHSFVSVTKWLRIALLIYCRCNWHIDFSSLFYIKSSKFPFLSFIPGTIWNQAYLHFHVEWPLKCKKNLQKSRGHVPSKREFSIWRLTLYFKANFDRQNYIFILQVSRRKKMSILPISTWKWYQILTKTSKCWIKQRTDLKNVENAPLSKKKRGLFTVRHYLTSQRKLFWMQYAHHTFINI